VHRAAGNAGLTGNGEAALLCLLLAGKGDDAGIDQLKDLTLDAFDHDNAAENAHLRCGKADAVGVMHGIDHIVDQGMKTGVKFFYGAAFLAKHGVAHFYNLSNSHDK
jgi:hypothetical protein